MNMQQALQIAQKRIGELQALADTQAAIINEKNDEIASLRQQVSDLEAALRYAQAHSYTDDFAGDEVRL